MQKSKREIHSSARWRVSAPVAKQDERYRAILKSVERLNPDTVCKTQEIHLRLGSNSKQAARHGMLSFRSDAKRKIQKPENIFV